MSEGTWGIAVSLFSFRESVPLKADKITRPHPFIPSSLLNPGREDGLMEYDDDTTGKIADETKNRRDFCKQSIKFGG